MASPKPESADRLREVTAGSDLLHPSLLTLDIMKFIPVLLPIVIIGFVAGASPTVLAQNTQDPIAVARSAMEADRQSAVKNALQLTADESQKFWPLYDRYRADMDKIGDALVETIKEYAAYYPDVPDDRAQKLLKQYIELEKSFTATRARYLEQFSAVLPGAKAMRLAQVESRLDLAVRLRLAASVPIMPVEGRLTPQGTAAVVTEPAVPGGVAVKVVELRAAVISIDLAGRTLTLLGSDGIKETIKVGPEVANFTQIRPGDQVRIKGTEALVVQMAGPDEPVASGGAAALATAADGSKPGAAAAGTITLVGTIQEIDQPNRVVTLRFEDGSTRTFPVRSDIDLSKRNVGEKVVFRYSMMVAASVAKP